MSFLNRIEEHFHKVVTENNLCDEVLTLTCKALTAEEAIGTPEHNDYPIQFGKEQMIEADFKGYKGQAFSLQAKQGSYTLQDVLKLHLANDWERAVFYSSLNAVYAYLGLVDRTIHCKNSEPVECAGYLTEIIPAGSKTALFGLQPRFLEKLAEIGEVRCIDIAPELVGTTKSGVIIEGPDATSDVFKWCDTVLATGSSLVNGSFDMFLHKEQPVYVFGTTGAAVSYILGQKRYCKCAK